MGDFVARRAGEKMNGGDTPPILNGARKFVPVRESGLARNVL
jgi:hypothetical protein